MNPNTFLSILQGIGSGKVINGGPNDDVFVYFADHGGHETVNFPNDFLSAKTLTNTLKMMHKKNMWDSNYKHTKVQTIHLPIPIPYTDS